MSRTTLYSGLYLAVVAAASAAALALLAVLDYSPVALAVVFAVLLTPGRVLGYFWRDLFRGLRRLNAGDFAQAKLHSERFIEQVRRRPWLKRLIWLGGSRYSRDPEVLALNNLGVAEIRLGEREAGRGHLDEAITRDPHCPLPYLNIGMLLEDTGQADEARPWFDQAARLGYRGGISDWAFRKAQARFAAAEGKGPR